MKKIKITVCAILASMSLMCSSCAVGSFAVLNKCYEFNNTITPNKYINAVVSFFLYPFETGIGGFIDTVILNTVEFWTGSNPLAEVVTVKATDGTYYAVAPTENGGYSITNQANGQTLALNFEKGSRTWTAECDGMSKKLITLVDENNAIVYDAEGNAKNITLDEVGVMACQQIAASSNFDMAQK